MINFLSYILRVDDLDKLIKELCGAYRVPGNEIDGSKEIFLFGGFSIGYLKSKSKFLIIERGLNYDPKRKIGPFFLALDWIGKIDYPMIFFYDRDKAEIFMNSMNIMNSEIFSDLEKESEAGEYPDNGWRVYR